jgi:hypothetical protein
VVRERDGREGKKGKKGKKLLPIRICWTEVDHSGKGRKGKRETQKTAERGNICAELIAGSWCLRPSESQMDIMVECSKM